MGLLRTILYILLVYYLFKILSKWFAPKLFRYAAKKTEAHFKGQFGNFAQEPTPSKQNEGEVSFDNKNTPKSNPSKKVGEYIDFEEIE